MNLDKILDQVQIEFNERQLSAYVCEDEGFVTHLVCRYIAWIECYDLEKVDQVHQVLNKYGLRISDEHKEFDYLVIDLDV